MADRDFSIDPEIEDYLPKLTPEEFEGLRQLIVANEYVDPLVVLFVRSENARLLGDGHNRLSICEGEGIEYTTRTIEVEDRSTAIQWIIDNQLSRRNLTDERRRYFRGKEYLLQKANQGGDHKSEKSNRHFDGLIGTAAKVAEKHGVSPRTIERDAEFADAVDAIAAKKGPEAKEAILSGQSGQSRKEVVEKAPILCRPCRIHGAKPGCNACKDARGEAAKEKKTERKPKDTLKDGYGNEVPARCRDAWADPWIDETVQTLRGLVSTFRQFRLGSAMDKRKKHYPFFDATDFIHGAGMIDNTFDKLIEHLETLRPSGVCPTCSGTGCGGCRMAGMVPKAVYEKLKEKA